MFSKTKITDYMGTFCVAIFGADELANKYKDNEDDYNAIMVQALADRFAEAFAEYLHYQIRTKHWGYAVSENLNNDELINREKELKLKFHMWVHFLKLYLMKILFLPRRFRL